MWSEEDLRLVLYSVIQFKLADKNDYDLLAGRLSDIIGKSPIQIKNLIIISNYDTMTIEELEEEYKLYEEEENKVEYSIGDEIEVNYVHGSIKHKATGVVIKEYPRFYMVRMEGGYITSVNK